MTDTVNFNNKAQLCDEGGLGVLEKMSIFLKSLRYHQRQTTDKLWQKIWSRNSALGSGELISQVNFSGLSLINLDCFFQRLLTTKAILYTLATVCFCAWKSYIYIKTSCCEMRTTYKGRCTNTFYQHILEYRTCTESFDSRQHQNSDTRSDIWIPRTS